MRRHRPVDRWECWSSTLGPVTSSTMRGPGPWPEEQSGPRASPGSVDSPPERRESVPYGPELLRRQPGQDSVMVMLPVAAPLLDDEVSLRCEADTVEARIPLQASGLRLSLDPPIGM